MYYARFALVYAWFAFSVLATAPLNLFSVLRKNSNRNFCRLFSWGASLASGIRVRVEGVDNLYLEERCVYVANHQSFFDVAVFGKIFPGKTLVVGKKEVAWIPFFNLIFITAGNILIDRSRQSKAVSMLRAAAAQLREKKASIWIFPEGTRNRNSNELLPFKKGAFHLAIEEKLPIVPVVSSSLSSILRQPKWKFRGGTVTVKILPPIRTLGLRADDAETLSTDIRETMSRTFQNIAVTLS